MKAILALFLGLVVLCQGQINVNYGLSGYIGDSYYNQFGGPQALTFDSTGEVLWALYSNVTTQPATGVLVAYSGFATRSSPVFPNDDPNPIGLFPFTVSDTVTLPIFVLNITQGIRGLTFNAANNFVLVGSRPDSEDALGVLEYFDTTCDGVTWTLNTKGELISGPVEAIFPLSCQLNGIAYVASSDSYFVTDASQGSLYETIVTCCREIEPPTPPENRWLQQLLLRRGVGLQYGLRGNNNIFSRSEPAYSTVASPGLGSPQDVTYDSTTGNLWVVNNFPVAALLEVTTDYIVVNHYNLEDVTGGLKDASAVALNGDYLVVGFNTEGYIAVFERPPSTANNGRELVLAHRTTPEEARARAEKARLESLAAAAEKLAPKVINKVASAEKNSNNKNKDKSARKSHFH